MNPNYSIHYLTTLDFYVIIRNHIPFCKLFSVKIIQNFLNSFSDKSNYALILAKWN